jgi:cyclophilin family peptidyl-prolyl cis-trans isomerase
MTEPTYRGTEFHRIIPGFMIQGGDFTNFDGTGGHAAPTTNNGLPTFNDENFAISHSSEGILSMANRGRNTNGSQFFITLNKTLHLDGKHVAFGRVVEGMEVVREVGRVETEGDNGRPVRLQRVVIVDCGEGMGGDIEKNSNEDSSRSSRSERRKRKKHHSKRKRKKHDRHYEDESENRKKHSKHSKRHKRDRNYKYGSSDDDGEEKTKRTSPSSHLHRDCGEIESHALSTQKDDNHRSNSKKRH